MTFLVYRSSLDEQRPHYSHSIQCQSALEDNERPYRADLPLGRLWRAYAEGMLENQGMEFSHITRQLPYLYQSIADEMLYWRYESDTQ
jgi:hypothetical protein